MALCRDHGKEHENYYIIGGYIGNIGYILGLGIQIPSH